MTGASAATASRSFGSRDLLLASRPVSWINTGLPFFAAAFAVVRGLDPSVLLGTLYFLGPYNLLLYGVNDVFDYASDVANPRKRSLEGGLVAPTHARAVLIAILATNIPPLIVLGWLGGPIASAALVVTVAVALAYSAPPLRTKVRPFLDSVTSALHFVLPAVCGFLVAGLAPADLPWLILGGFLAWGIASHALGAIQDIAYDRAAQIGSIATTLGARRTALVSLVGYLMAVVVAATMPSPWGAAAALALTPYLLLPAMVLARDDEPQARRAWRSFMQLNLLVGFVLAQLLLRHWEITTWAAWELAIAVAAVAAGWTLANTLLLAAATRRVDTGPRTLAPLPSLTIVVPCRNEAARLRACLAALAAQRYPGPCDVLVVDDGSTDGSASLAADALAPMADAGRVVAAAPMPAGWSGKSWAVAATGVAESEGDLVLVVDADTVLRPDAASTLVRQLLAQDADLVSGVTRYAMRGTGELVTMPGYPMLLFGFVPAWLAAWWRERPAALAFAYGPLILVRRDAYLATGGHAAVPESHREDIDLARTFARLGRRVVTVHAADLAATRHYAGWRAVLGSWSRILPGYTDGSVAVALAMLAGEVLAYLLPLLLPLVAVAIAPDRIAPSLVPLAVLVAARVAQSLTQRLPLAAVVLHPLTILTTLAGQVVALAGLVAGRTPAWRGRPMPDLRAAAAPGVDS
ncbi:MAG TPA: prenyltransferase [Candidatus Limnocylindrales bacterium]|nr:prenyltransferase [Candidatus Limnocylindrales bacterium]